VADNDPEPIPPDEMSMGGAAYMRAYKKWEEEDAAWHARHPAPGPAPKPSATNYTPSSSKGAYDLSGFSAGAIAEAEQEANDFAGWLGWPTWFNLDAMVKNLLQVGVQGDPTQAYEFLWTQLGADRQKGNINAYFGLSKQQYTEKLNNLKDMFYNYTGDTAVPESIRNQALRENWTQSELLDALQADPSVGATAPWLAVGQSYRDILGQWGQQYGTGPQSKAQIASWWKFRIGATAVTSGGPAQQTYQPPQPLITRPLSQDVETR
jgi:hypothetical protein